MTYGHIHPARKAPSFLLPLRSTVIEKKSQVQNELFNAQQHVCFAVYATRLPGATASAAWYPSTTANQKSGAGGRYFNALL